MEGKRWLSRNGGWRELSPPYWMASARAAAPTTHAIVRGFRKSVLFGVTECMLVKFNEISY